MTRSAIILIIIALGLAATYYLVFQKTQFFSKAGTDDIPQKIHITNVTDTAFTVSWVTQKEVIGFISLQQGGNENTINDDRDKDRPKKRFTHHVSLKKLNPATKYSFKIGSGSKVVDKYGKPFEVSTAPISNNTPPLAQPVFGKILNADKTAQDDVLVYINIPGATPLSSYTKESGNFLITLTNARTANLQNYIEIEEGRQFNIKVEAGPQGSVIKPAVVNTQTALEDIILGKQ